MKVLHAQRSDKNRAPKSFSWTISARPRLLPMAGLPSGSSDCGGACASPLRRPRPADGTAKS